MKSCLYWFLLAAWSAIGFAPQGPSLWAKDPTGGNIIELGGLKSRVPADWAEQVPDDPDGYKQYRLEPVNDDKAYACISIYSLGREKAATAADYVKRWKGMFLPPEGQTMDEAARVRQLTVSGAAVTCLDVHGDYKGLPGNPATPRENYRLLGVYFDTPQGAYMIRLFGPADTVGFYRNEFENWVKAFK